MTFIWLFRNKQASIQRDVFLFGSADSRCWLLNVRSMNSLWTLN